MSTTERPSAMQRKAGAGRPPPEIGAPTAAKALRTALMQAGEDVAALTVVASMPCEARVTLGPLVDELAEHTLLGLIEGPDARYGLVLLDPQSLSALIEIQTTGRVVPRPAEPRPPTRTDAIMCADFIDRILELLEERAAEAELAIAPELTGFRYAVTLPEPRAIPLTLEDIPYRRFSVELDLGRGAKQGQIDVVLPLGAAPQVGRATPSAEGGEFGDVLAENVLEAEAHLMATLHRLALPLTAVTALEVGSLLPIPETALAEVAVEDIEGRVICHGGLGMSGGNRAIRLSDGESDTAPAGLPTAAQPAPLPDMSAMAPADLPGLDEAPEPLADLSGLGAGDLGAEPVPAEMPDMSDLPELADLGDFSAMAEPAG